MVSQYLPRRILGTVVDDFKINGVSLVLIVIGLAKCCCRYSCCESRSLLHLFDFEGSSTDTYPRIIYDEEDDIDRQQALAFICCVFLAVIVEIDRSIIALEFERIIIVQYVYCTYCTRFK